MKYIPNLDKTNFQNKLLVIGLIYLGLLLLSASSGRVFAQNTVPKKTVVLVHGTFADGSSWEKIIPLLQAKGFNVIAVQNPLTSLANDVAVTKRAIDSAPGEVILVGHSWGGTVITQAGNNEKVKALVYIAAFALSKDQSVNDLYKEYPAPEWFGSAKADSSGFLTLLPGAFNKYFAQDLTTAQTSIMASTQAPVSARAFDDKVTETAWSNKPSWYIVAANDRMISPDIQKATAKKIGATITVLQTSHVPMLSKPKEVADVVLVAGGISKE